MASFTIQPLETLPETPPWDPTTVNVAMNLRMDAAFVPRADGDGARVAYSHIVVLDDFFTEAQRLAMLEGIADKAAADGQAAHPPQAKWERKTADGAGLPPTWGLQPHAMAELQACDAAQPLGRAMRQVHGRLCALYPGYLIGHMPSEAIQGAARADGVLRGEEDEEEGLSVQQHKVHTAHDGTDVCGDADEDDEQQQKEGVQPPAKRARSQVDCGQFVANAAVAGDCFQWHIDADPSAFWPGAWVERYGHYFNGEAGRPLLVTLLLYLDKEWPRDCDAETLFLESGSDTGVLVRPRAYRAVLMDQDVLHRLSVPSTAAGRPRYSLVWKLVFCARGGVAPCIAQPAFGAPVDFGTAARMRALRHAVSLKDNL